MATEPEHHYGGFIHPNHAPPVTPNNATTFGHPLYHTTKTDDRPWWQGRFTPTPEERQAADDRITAAGFHPATSSRAVLHGTVDPADDAYLDALNADNPHAPNVNSNDDLRTYQVEFKISPEALDDIKKSWITKYGTVADRLNYFKNITTL